ncbi:MAG: S8 family serine peptidase, partial [Bacteroidia bacterium]|nr:S8 family serine peptidase [Bacteroidia bacterium]
MDLTVIPDFYSGDEPIPGDSIDVTVTFKVNKSNLSAKAAYKFGTSQDNGNVLNALGIFKKENKLLPVMVLLISTVIILSYCSSAQTVYTVTDTTDFDPFLYLQNPNNPQIVGKLQWAVWQTNDTPGPCIIIFNIAGSGPHTIILNFRLPTIKNSVIIDGTSQNGYLYGHPQIIIDGQNMVFSCFYFLDFPNIMLKGIHIRNFMNVGVMFNSCNSYIATDNIITNIDNGISVTMTCGIRLLESQGIIKGNFIGTDSDILPNNGIEDYGIYIQNASNNIIGGTGVNEGNTIAWCGLRGINIFSSNFVKITGNRLFNNTVGIWLANANMNKMAPVITSFTGITVSGTSQPGNNIEVFGSTGNENANVYLTSVTADADGSWTTTVSNPNYDYVIATATDVQGNTSMFSVAKLKEIPLTQLQAQDCGATDVALDQPLYAIPVPGATGYEFLVENKSLNFSESIIRNNNELKLIQLNSLPQSDIEYNIVVRVLVNSVIGNFGDTCTITTEPDSARYLTNELYMKIFDDEDFDPLYDPANNKYTIFSTFNEIMEKFAVKKVAPAFPNSDSKILQKIYSIEISNYSEVDSLIIYCQQSFPFMEYIEKIPVYKTTVNDPQYTYQWHLPLINSENAWVIQADASDVVVAIIDNAVLIDHLDLINNININQGELNLIAYPNLDSNGDGYVSSAELINGCSCSDLTSAILYFSNNIDDDDNGYKDDIAGWDAAHNDNNPGPSPVSPATINDFQHGTHCAGIAGASTNNFIGIASIASNVRLIPVKTKLDFSTGGNLQSTAEGIYYAMQAGANIISMSFGGPGINDTYVNLMNVAHQKGIVLVASAGNDFTTTPSYPASSDHVISVGATNRYDNITVYSNYGDNIDIMAPGGDDGLLEDGIFSCFATSNSAYGYMIGTSQACPLVAGLCALMKSYAPSATPDEIETCLIENAQELNLAHGCNQQTNDFFVAGLLGDGRIDAVNALTCFMTVPYPEFSSDYTVVCPNQSVQFFNESTGPTVTGWYWEFEGGTPATSAEQNPVVIFSSTGTYDVTLTVSNVYGNNTKIKSDYIVVGIPYASIFYNTPTEACSGERSYVYAEFTGVGPWTLYYNQISGSTITPLSITATESPYPIEILIGDQPVTIELTGMESQFCTGTATGSITFNPIDCNIECNILSLGNFETLTNSSFNQFSNFCPETYTDAVSYLMTSVNAYEGLKYIKLYCAYKTCGKYVSGLYLPFDEPLLDGHTYQIEFYGLCQNPTYPLVRFYASETIPCQLPNDWNDCGTFTPNLLTNISIFSNQWTKYTANITNNTGSDLNYLVFYVAGYENWVSIDYLRVLKADLQQLDISSVISDNLPCIGETLNIAYTICLPENVTTNAEAIDLSVIIPQGFTILPTSEFLADGTYSISAGMLSHPCNFQLSLDLKVEESIITNTPLNIHLLISSSNSCIISDPSSVINEITIYEDILILNKSTEQEQFNPGDYIPYVIEVTNTSSNTTISNIVIEDLLDLSFDDATLNTADFIYSTSDRKLYTNPFFLLPNETKIFDYQAKLVTDILYCSEINNCAKVISANDVCELPVSCTSIGEAASGITATYSVSNVSCWGGNNGSINLTVTGGSGGYSFIWSTGATTEDISHLIAGTYSVRITDSNGCFIIENITITQPEQLLSAIISFPNHCCSGASGSIELNIIGGMTPYSFLWSNGATTEDIGYLASGNYIVTITDANGCPLIDNDFIHCHVSLVDKYNKTNVSCYGGNDGSVWIFEPTDGTPPYSYVWSNGPSTLGIYNLTAGNYSLTVTDADGCYAVLSVEIIQPLPLNINYTVSNSSCYGANNGSIDITTTGGTTPYAYLWSTGQTIEDITGLAAGTYSVTVTDAHSCTSVTSVIISDIGLVMDLGFTITNVKCYGNSTGAINLTVEGGTPGYTYQWSDGQTLED